MIVKCNCEFRQMIFEINGKYPLKNVHHEIIPSLCRRKIAKFCKGCREKFELREAIGKDHGKKRDFLWNDRQKKISRNLQWVVRNMAKSLSTIVKKSAEKLLFSSIDMQVGRGYCKFCNSSLKKSRISSNSYKKKKNLEIYHRTR